MSDKNRRVLLSSYGTYNIYVAPITREQFDFIHENSELIGDREDNPIKLYGETASITMMDADKYVEKIKLPDPDKKRMNFLANLKDSTREEYDAEHNFYKCYCDPALNRKHETITEALTRRHETAASSFKCATEKIGYPDYCVIYGYTGSDDFNFQTYYSKLTEILAYAGESVEDN